MDMQFVFQVFGVLRKRQICMATCLQITKADFHRNERAIRSIDANALMEASREEMEKKPISNPAVRSLKRHLTAIRAKVMGTDESRQGGNFLHYEGNHLMLFVRYSIVDLGDDNS